MNKKQRIVDGQGASNINCSAVVFNFDVCRLSCFDLCDWLHHLVSFRIRTKNHRVHSHSLGTGPAVGGKGGVKWKTGERIEASDSLGKGNGGFARLFFFFFFFFFFRFFFVFPYCGTWSQASIHSYYESWRVLNSWKRLEICKVMFQTWKNIQENSDKVWKNGKKSGAFFKATTSA